MENQGTSSSRVSRTELMSAILYSQYSPDALLDDLQYSAKDHLSRVEASMQHLNSWSTKNHICCGETDIRRRISNSKDPDDQQRAIHEFFSYHLSVFFIHCPWLPLFSSHKASLARGEALLQLKQRSIEASLDSAFTVIKLANEIVSSDSKIVR